jgi:hypothetical protein
MLLKTGTNQGDTLWQCLLEQWQLSQLTKVLKNIVMASFGKRQLRNVRCKIYL